MASAAVSRAALLILSAGVLPAGMTLAVIVMIALNVGVVIEISREQSVYSVVGAARYPAVQTDPRLRESGLRAAANSAADQGINAKPRQQTRQGSVTAAVSVNDLRAYYLSVLDLEQLKLLRVPEVLKNISVFISYRNFHKFFLSQKIPRTKALPPLRTRQSEFVLYYIIHQYSEKSKILSKKLAAEDQGSANEVISSVSARYRLRSARRRFENDFRD